MKITANNYAAQHGMAYAVETATAASPAADAAQAQQAAVPEEEAAVWLPSATAQQEEDKGQQIQRLLQEMAEQKEALSGLFGSEESSASAKMGSSAQLQNDAPQLTRRLVIAATTFEVRQVVGEANRSMINLRLAAAMGDEETAKTAKGYIKKLQKLLQRAKRKISDLDDESDLQRKQLKAEQEQQKQRAAELEETLRKRQIERKNRERGYLREANEEPASPGTRKLDAATEAKIAAQAQAMAAVQSAAAPVAAESAVAEGAAPAGDSGGDNGAATAEGGEAPAVAGAAEVAE